MCRVVYKFFDVFHFIFKHRKLVLYIYYVTVMGCDAIRDPNMHVRSPFRCLLVYFFFIQNIFPASLQFIRIYIFICVASSFSIHLLLQFCFLFRQFGLIIARVARRSRVHFIEWRRPVVVIVGVLNVYHSICFGRFCVLLWTPHCCLSDTLCMCAYASLWNDHFFFAFIWIDASTVFLLLFFSSDSWSIPIYIDLK